MAGGLQLAEENKVKREQFLLLTTRVLATVECLKFLRLMVVRYTLGRRLRAALSILMRRISRILGPGLVRTSTMFVVVWVISFCCRTINRIKRFENVRTLPLANLTKVMPLLIRAFREAMVSIIPHKRKKCILSRLTFDSDDHTINVETVLADHG